MLVVVIDGMSVAVFRELMADVTRSRLGVAGGGRIGLRPALATVPSVTEVSRTSLLTGKLGQGQRTERESRFR